MISPAPASLSLTPDAAFELTPDAAFDAYAAAVRNEVTVEQNIAHVAAVLSSATFRSLSTQQPLEAMTRLARIAPSAGAAGARTMADVFDAAYATLRRDYRNEYVFKNTIVSNIVFGRHRPTTASAILELPVGFSFADVAVFNGTSTVYEIKTDLDSFARLDSQIRDYSSRIEFVHVVVSDARAIAAERYVPDHVGVLALRRNGALTEVRPAQSNRPRLRSEHIFGLLRRAEAERVVGAAAANADGGPAERWEALRSAFAALDSADAHRGAVNALRLRGMQATRVAAHAELPQSARALAYSATLSKAAGERLLRRLQQPIPPVWGV
ncbi:sce7726 family protein [Curtobacterium sp. 9128]|uniref:sce7726 family protein n=1 Tax=Curtobacterium sp. 9128 TaxID=1793722 RepID=UPI00119CF522|nr:sce7726 family protein [Curtobacterium sp. 9128]